MLLGLQSLCKDVYNAHIRIRTDNTTCVAYIKHKGGLKSENCNRIAKEIWEWALTRNNFLSVVHLPGRLNDEADFESRNQNNNTEWALKDDTLDKVFCSFNQVPSIDLFASRLNFKLPRYVSWKPDPGAMCIDVFQHSFPEELFYAFPPFNIVNRFLRKVELEKMEGIVIAPLWSTQVFYPVLMELLIDFPILLNWEEDLVWNPVSDQTHPLGAKLRLAACHVSQEPTKRKAFLERLWGLSCRDGGSPPPNNIRCILRNGFISVPQGIPIRLLRI